MLIEHDATGWLGDANKVIRVSPLLRNLLEAACDIPPEYDRDGGDSLVMALLLAEVDQAPTVPHAVPFPKSAELARKCQAFLEAPSPHDTIDRWSDELGMGRRAFTRIFRKETGLSFGAWRPQACLLVSLPRLSAGESVSTIAMDLDDDNPAAFTSMFKRHIGMAPSHYRQPVEKFRRRKAG